MFARSWKGRAHTLADGFTDRIAFGGDELIDEIMRWKIHRVFTQQRQGIELISIPRSEIQEAVPIGDDAALLFHKRIL